MSFNIIRHEWFINRKSTLVWVAMIGGFLAMFAGFTSFITGNDQLGELLKSYPKALLDAFNFSPEAFSSFEGWMGSEPYAFFVLLLGIYAAVMASATIAREVDQKTGEFLFILPSNRRSIFYSKVVAQFALITVVFVVSLALGLIVGRAVAVVNNLGGLLLLFLSAYLIALASAGVGYAVTSLVNGERTALSVGIGFVVLTFLLNGLAGLDKAVSWLADFSVQHAFNGTRILAEKALPWPGVLVCLGIYAVGMVLGAELLARKNLSM